ncbi:MAG: dihydrolipoamide acetyltransferase family protein [Anaerolineales bacterium]
MRETHTGNGYPVVMPKLGLTMTEAKIVEWHKGEGEEVARGDVLFTLETEKSTLDIEAQKGGLLHILAAEGETVPVKTVIARIEEAAAEPGTPRPEVEVEEPRAETARVRAAPKARLVARERGVDLTGLTGTGPRGMVVVADVERAAEATHVRATPVARRVAEHLGVDLSGVEGTGPRGRVVRADVERMTQEQPAPAPATVAPPTPLTGLRAVIAERIAQSWREQPQVTLVTVVDATALAATRAQLNAELASKVSYNAFLVKAVAKALREHPYANVALTDEGLVQRESIHVGLAVDTERGLLVPVLQDADRIPLLTVDRELRALTERALEGSSRPDELTGGSITVTNLGMYGIDAFTPILNPPESVILGVGQIAPQPVVVDGQVTVRETVTLSLVFDHRVMDGAPAARFLQRIRQLLERPAVLFIK